MRLDTFCPNYLSTWRVTLSSVMFRTVTVSSTFVSESHTKLQSSFRTSTVPLSPAFAPFRIFPEWPMRFSEWKYFFSILVTMVWLKPTNNIRARRTNTIESARKKGVFYPITRCSTSRNAEKASSTINNRRGSVTILDNLFGSTFVHAFDYLSYYLAMLFSISYFSFSEMDLWTATKYSQQPPSSI